MTGIVWGRFEIVDRSSDPHREEVAKKQKEKQTAWPNTFCSKEATRGQEAAYAARDKEPIFRQAEHRELREIMRPGEPYGLTETLHGAEPDKQSGHNKRRHCG